MYIYERLGTLAEKKVPEAEKRQKAQMTRDCANVDVVQTLERVAVTPAERVTKLIRKISVMPRIVQGHAIKRKLINLARERGLTDKELQQTLSAVDDVFPEMREFPFPDGYAVGSLESEVAKARCELSRARLELLVFNRTGRVPGRLLR